MRTGNAMTHELTGKATQSLACRALICGLLLCGTHVFAEDTRVPTMPTAFVAPVPELDTIDTIQGSETPALSLPTALDSETATTKRAVVQSIQDIKFSQPRDVAQSDFTSMRVPTTYRTKSWVAPRAVHRTLFFQDNALERHGKTNNAKLQPAVSTARFFVDAILYPARQLADARHPVHYATSPR